MRCAGINGPRTVLRKHEQPQRGGEVPVLPAFINFRDEAMKRDFPLGGD
jgi:hypothetical protein